MLGSPHRAADAMLVAACVMQLLTIREGQPWGDDFAQYVTHARNLVEHRPYDDIGLLRAGQRLGPPEYPPVFPAMLAPAYAVFGPSLRAFEVVGIVSLLLALLLFRRIVAATLTGGHLVAWALLVGFHPYFYGFATSVLSEPAFMLWTAAALLALDRWGDASAPPRTAAVRGALIGVLVALAVGTRTIGVALLPALALIAWRGRSPRHLPATALATAALSIAALTALVPGQFDYGARLAHVRPIPHVQLYWADLTSFLPGFDEPSALGALNAFRQIAGVAPVGGQPAVRLAIALVALTLGVVATAGFVLAVRRGVGPVEVFVLAYLPFVIAYPIRQGPRFVMPLLPILFAYLIDAVARSRLDRRRSGHVVLATLLAASLLLHGRGLARTDVPDAYGTAEARRFLDFVRTGVPDDAVIAFAKPRALYLLTGRRGFCPHEVPDEPLWHELETNGVTHVVVGGPHPGFLGRFATRFPDRLRPVYASAEFTVLRIDPPPIARPAA